uniref:TRAF3-interacting protein 1 n=1 Tax=Globisporangium ultimum (strain ATCC 200006 / CBS 805.95 / DAOM BR144) TaxID=431595 RepID=K3WMZ2_GLOUD
MGDSVEALIPKTQELLQPLIAKPKLADKLLMKPPFRFLHDIFTALATATGFANGLYNDFELDSANMKEKNQKITYLDKMVVCVGQCLGKDVDVRSAKVVAGLEPENTNVFLQCLAQAASNASLDWAGAVQKTLAKIPSLTPDGGASVPTAAAAAAPAPAAEAKASAPLPERPASKERPSSSEAEKVAAAETKAKEKVLQARKEKEDVERKEKEQKVETAAKKRELEEAKATKAEANPPVAESKSGSNSRASSSSSSRGAKPPPDNNKELDDSVMQQIKECNGDVERTKDLIEKIIQKPKMAAKLLSKPPFRFIHDIVSEITRVTGFAEGLYNAEELDSGSIKEKGPKIDYLNKIILCVSCQLNVELEAKSAKIVAGLEPDDTNKFLQLLAIACRSGSSTEAVQRVLLGDTALRAAGAVKKASSGGSSSSSSSKAAEREATPEAKLSSRSTTPLETKGRPSSKEGKEPSSSTAPSASSGTFGGPMKPLALKTEEEDNEENTNLRFNSESKDAGEDMVAPGTSSGLGTSRTSRPTTARRRPPKLKENVTEVGRLMAHDMKVAPVVGIMKDGDNGDSDDDTAVEDNNNGGSSNNNASLLREESGRAHGKLVRDILKDQSAEETARKQKEDEDTSGANEAETGIRLGRRKKSFKDKSKSGASNVAEMNELRNNIQKICQATNPVGKGVEFVHEDLDTMSKELEYWKKEYEKKRDLYEEEKKKTEEALQPLQMQLLEVDELIKEQVHKINSLKATIAKNEEKTQKLLYMVVSA